MTPTRARTALIADDEPFLAADLKSRIEAAWPQLHIVAVCHDGIEALEFIEAHRPDIAFLDIRMPGMSGLEVAAQIDYPCQAVFVTAHDQYAIQAFELAAVDYLLKPVDDQRLHRTIERLRATRTLPTPEPNAGPDHGAPARSLSPLRWIRAALGNEIRLVKVEDVMYFQALDKYTIVVTPDQQLLIRTRIRELLLQLDPDQFWQIHRGSIVNLKYVNSVRQDGSAHWSICLQGNPQTLSVSRAFVARFRQM